jgi:hypothetical protein
MPKSKRPDVIKFIRNENEADLSALLGRFQGNILVFL